MILYIENLKDSIRKLIELISEFSSCRIKKSIQRNHLNFYIPIMKTQREKLRNQSHLPLQQKKLKYLGINLLKEMKELYTENYKMLVKEIKDDINRWRDIPYSWLGRINIVKITILPNTIYSFNYHGIFHGTRKKKKNHSSFENRKDPEWPKQS